MTKMQSIRTPEDVVNAYDFSESQITPENIEIVRKLLVSRFNTEALNEVIKTGRLPDAFSILRSVPSRIKELRSKCPELFGQTAASSAFSQSSEFVTVRVDPEAPPVPLRAKVDLAPTKTHPDTANVPFPNLTVQEAPAANGPTQPITQKSGRQIPKKDAETLLLDFISQNYTIVEAPSVKFMDVLEEYQKSSGIKLGSQWGKKWATFMDSHKIKYARLPLPGYSSGGTFHVSLVKKV